MSRRTSESNKAIRIAWSNEQKLVQEGKGTRDWTPDQQQDILDKGKAYDKDGRAFEGQHMMSAEKYPEFQSNPENIQFLTRGEHLEAHDGNWQNPTNWYFNPITKEKTNFSSENFKPCEIIDLCDPVFDPQVKQEIGTENFQETIVQTSNKSTQKGAPRVIVKAKSDIKIKSKPKIGQLIKRGRNFIVENRQEIGRGLIILVGLVAIWKSSSERSSNSEDMQRDYSPNDYDNTDENTYTAEEYEQSNDEKSSDETENDKKGSGKCPHDRREFTRKNKNGTTSQVKATRVNKDKESNIS